MLRLGCSKLNTHRYQSKTGTNKCIYCDSEETTSHFLFECNEYIHIKDKFISEINSIDNKFQHKLNEYKVSSILCVTNHNLDDNSSNLIFLIFV